MLEIAKVCGCWAIRRCCFQSITFNNFKLVGWLGNINLLCHHILKTAIS